MNRDLRNVLGQLEDLVEQPTTMTSLQRLQETFGKADSLAAYVTPAQTVCNYWNYFWTLLPEHLTERGLDRLHPARLADHAPRRAR